MPEHTVEIQSIPSTVEEFLAYRNEVANQHLGGAAVFVLALYTYSRDAALGLQFLTIALDRDSLADGLKGYKGKQPSRMAESNFQQRIGRAPHIARSYFRGTSPENQYALPAPPLQIAIRIQDRPSDVTEEKAKLFVHSTGADSPRPLHLKKNNRGIWKATNWSSLEVGIRPPAVVEDDDI